MKKLLLFTLFILVTTPTLIFANDYSYTEKQIENSINATVDILNVFKVPMLSGIDPSYLEMEIHHPENSVIYTCIVQFGHRNIFKGTRVIHLPKCISKNGFLEDIKITTLNSEINFNDLQADYPKSLLNPASN